MSSRKKVAIYCRLSKDDEQNGDSVSIETQKIMLKKYCEEHQFDIFDFYVDDGYSGLNYNRPAFKRLIADLEAGKIDIVITKDLSRLGRDYIKTGYYIDIFFVEKNIRYIAVNDDIDTKRDDNDIAPFKNIMNDMYAKDLSRKIKSAKKQRAQNGFYISAQPPFGYVVDPFDRKRLIVDNKAAEVVRLIFKLAEEGNNYSQISKKLEEKQILSPSNYKTLNGDTRFLKSASNESKKYKWPYQTVKAILNNQVYVGDMVNHKVETINYKSKQRRCVPVEEQIIVKDRHEAIIERERFEEINERLSNRRKSNNKFENVFKGMVYCAECGKEMRMISKQLKYEDKPMLKCLEHMKNNQICTHNHYIYYDELLYEINQNLKSKITEIVESERFFLILCGVKESILDIIAERRKQILQQELIRTNKRIKETYKTISDQRGSYDSDEELSNLILQQKTISKKMAGSDKKEISISDNAMDYIASIIKDWLYSINFSEELLHLLVEKIEVGHLERGSGIAEQKIRIKYKF